VSSKKNGQHHGEILWIRGSPVYVHELRSNERKDWSKVLLERTELSKQFFSSELNFSNSSFLLKWTGSTIYFNTHFIKNEYFEKFSSFRRTVRSGQFVQKELFEKFSSLKRTVRSVPFVDNTVSNSSSVLNET
jgi:hypothetical protein